MPYCSSHSSPASSPTMSDLLYHGVQNNIFHLLLQEWHSQQLKLVNTSSDVINSKEGNEILALHFIPRNPACLWKYTELPWLIYIASYLFSFPWPFHFHADLNLTPKLKSIAFCFLLLPMFPYSREQCAPGIWTSRDVVFLVPHSTSHQVPVDHSRE